ncbi:phytanoyl-CoA dioxygenase family protein [Thalassotalea euphylliae]|uniref:phytanoyl-CoA dioxygenase family protein n=1 Tax=Thalassotalea euphylliae TaxID=1655234 RepID=UPI003644584E
MTQTLDYDALAKQFWRDGYIVIENFFDDALMEQYDQLILDQFGYSPEFWHTDEFLETTGVEVVPWFPQREGCLAFNTVSEDERFKALTQAILDDGWYEQYSMVMFSKQGTKGQAWHQDCPPDNSHFFNMNRLVYTMDVTEKGTGGQTLVMPGSHLKGMLPSLSESFPEQDKVVLSPKKGSIVFLHGHCWHSVLPVTGKYRVSTNYRCAPQGTPENITDIGIYRNIRYQFSTESIVEERD